MSHGPEPQLAAVHSEQYMQLWSSLSQVCMLMLSLQRLLQRGLLGRRL